MMDYDDGDDNRNNDGDKDGNNYGNAASGSGSDGPIFDWITTPRSSGGVSGDNGNGPAATAHYVSICRNIYLPFLLYLS